MRAAADLSPWLLLVRFVLALSIAVAAGAAAAAGPQAPTKAANVHTVFLNDCTLYSDWQTVVMVFGWRQSGQPGPITRVACCTPEDKATYLESRKGLLDLVPTHIAPSYAHHPRTGDDYAAYNKPAGVMDWLDKAPPEEEFILVLDSDMILRRPFIPAEYMQLERGWATGARYDYLIGVDNDLAERHVSSIARRTDTLAGPVGRRADRVGGFYYIHRDDLKRLAPLWLKYSEDVRADPEAWHLTGDLYSKRAGEKPWISEMYGYVFGAAHLGVWHKWDESSMIYPGYQPTGVPRILHYGLLWHLQYHKGAWSFDKHWFAQFDVTVCPPWEDEGNQRPTAGLFPAPPRPSELRPGLSRAERYRDLLSIEVVHTLNAATCEYHLRNCPPSKQLVRLCTVANAAYEETVQELRQLDAEMACTDSNEVDCKNWAKAGECDKNPDYMHFSCRLSCKLCTRSGPEHFAGHSGLAAELSKVEPPSNGARALPPPPPPPATAAEVDSAAEVREGRHTPLVGDGGPSKQQLLERRCYKWSELSMHQVKDCVRAARTGVEWQLHSSGEGGDSKAPTLAAAPVPGTEDLPALPGWRSHFSLGGAFIAWLGIVGMFLSVLPNLYRRSKRSRSTLGRGPKVSV